MHYALETNNNNNGGGGRGGDGANCVQMKWSKTSKRETSHCYHFNITCF